MGKRVSNNSRDMKICIIGAGIAGLKSAHKLKKLGYNNITIFESSDQVGGKIRSVEMDGRIYELGAIFIPKGSSTIENLVKEYNIKLTKYKRDLFFYSKGKQVSQMKCLRNNSGFFELMKCMFNVIGFGIKFFKYMKCIDKPGFTKIDPELYKNFQSYLEKNKVGLFTEIAEPLSFVYCYGYLNSTPAFYFLKLFQIGISFLIKDMLNSSLGFRFRLLPMFDNGYQNFLKKIASEFNVKLNSRVTEIRRDDNGDSCKIHVTSNEKTETFDNVIISSMPFDTLKFLDANEKEKELFSRIKYWYYQETLFRGDFDLRGAGLVMEKSFHKETKGFPSILSNFHMDNNIYLVYQMHDGTLSEDELKKKVYEMADILKARIDEIVLSMRIPYFPHYVEKDLVELDPYNKLEDMQGENGTYYVGCLLNFEGSNWSAEYADQLLEKHFS